MNLFARERELCEVFIRNRKDENLKFKYNISNRGVEITVCYKNKRDWNVKKWKK